MPDIHFVKMHGCGNDFVVIDAVRQKLPKALPAAQIAHRRHGIGCDQILILKKPPRGSDADFAYEIFNADGGSPGQCGNGARCAHVFLRRHKLTAKKRLRLITKNVVITTEGTSSDSVRAYLAVPEFAPDKIPLRQNIMKKWYAPDKTSLSLPGRFAALSLGNPHAVFVTGSDSLHETGAALNKLNKSALFPQGVNAGFCRLVKGKVMLRVYERGVGETPACGSGAVAAAVVLLRDGRVKNPVQVVMPGGELLCGWDGGDSYAWLEGAVASVFAGVIRL